MEKNTAVILKILHTSDEDKECANILEQLTLYGYTVQQFKINNQSDLKEALENGVDIKYDLIYLSAHGDEDGFANETGDFEMKWTAFAEVLYNSYCLAEDNILLLSACRGGLNKVAYELFYICPNIEFICGPRMSLDSSEMLIAYNIFLFNNIYKYIDPIVATAKVLSATDIRLKCFDRLETVAETDYLLHKQLIKVIPFDKNKDGTSDSIIVIGGTGERQIYNDEDAEEQAKERR